MIVLSTGYISGGKGRRYLENKYLIMSLGVSAY
nr:MAG TPA: hypothetical protein [Caudoviricetes sp.]